MCHPLSTVTGLLCHPLQVRVLWASKTLSEEAQDTEPWCGPSPSASSVTALSVHAVPGNPVCARKALCLPVRHRTQRWPLAHCTSQACVCSFKDRLHGMKSLISAVSCLCCMTVNGPAIVFWPANVPRASVVWLEAWPCDLIEDLGWEQILRGHGLGAVSQGAWM